MRTKDIALFSAQMNFERKKTLTSSVLCSWPSTWLSLLLFLSILSIFVIGQTGSESSRYILDVCSPLHVYESIPTDKPVKGTIVTPNRLTGETGYDINIDCSVALNYPPGGSVVFKFKFFDVEWVSNDIYGCPYDYYSIDGVKYCGYLNGKTLCISHTTDSKIYLHFFSDDWTGNLGKYQGMEMDFDTYTNDQCTCTANNTKNNGPLEACQFPFILGNKTYYQCTTAHSDTVGVRSPYCATAVDQDGVLIHAGTCSSGIKACDQTCRTVTGEECLFPVVEDGYQYSFCRRPTRNQVREGENYHQCPTFQGRATADGSVDIEQPMQNECDSNQCTFAVDCNEFDVLSHDGVFFSHQQFDNLNPYPLDSECNSSVRIDDMKNYRVTVKNLGVLCIEQVDYLQISDGSGGTVFHFCGLGYPGDATSYSFCLMNDVFEDMRMRLLFKSGNESKGERFGFMAEFYATSDPGVCAPYDDVVNNRACLEQEEIIISSNSTILSYNYPHPYPANLFCKWHIQADPINPNLYPVLEATNVDLGQKFDGAVTTMDYITISDNLQSDVVWSLETRDTVLRKPFVFTDRTGLVTFSSSYYFNYHTNFKLLINYLNIAENKQIFRNAGLCLSQDANSFCHFPYADNGEMLNTCKRQETTEPASCRNLDGQKIFCDMSIKACCKLTQ